MDALRLARRLRGRLGGRSEANSRTRPARSDSSGVDRIIGSGLFDRAYYEIQSGREFGTDEAAVQDFLQQGHRLGFSPHPLFEPEWFLAERPRNRPNSLLAYLDGGGGPHGPGPAFDETWLLERTPAADQHPGRALGHFVAQAGDDDLLPGAAGRLTWGRARALAHDIAREFRHAEDVRNAPRRGPWDEAADSAFVSGWLARERPPRAVSDGPVVSVVMPVRNRPVQVLEAIASVQAQTLPDWELLVVDDGSTDETPDVVARAAEADPRIRLVRRAPSGVSAARNAGIDAATGEWLAFLDSDNTWVPHFLQVMVGHLESGGLRAGHAVIDTQVESDGEVSVRYLAFDGGLDHLLVRNHIDLNGLMVQTAVGRDAGRFDESLRRWVDHDFAIRVARLTPIPRVPFVGVRYDHAPTSGDRITTTEPNSWEYVVLGKSHVDWDALEASVDERRADLVSVCIAAVDWVDTRVAIDSVLRAAAADDVDLEVVVVVNGARRSVGAILRALYDGDPRVRIESLPRNLTFSIGANAAFAASSGGTVVFLDSDTEVLDGWLRPLTKALDDPEVLGCQALLLDRDGAVQCAGWAFSGVPALPSALLAGHPPDDVRRAAPLGLRAVSASALAMRAHDVVGLRGFDPWFAHGYEDVDLCLRAVAGGRRRFRVAPDSRVVHHRHRVRPDEREQEGRKTWMRRWATDAPPTDLGVLEGLALQVAHLSPGEPVGGSGDVRIPTPVVIRPPRSVTDGPASGEPSLRWALKTPVALREAGSSDLDLAVSLADALRRLGQDVAVDRLESHQRSSSYLDDVALMLGRASLPVAQPGRVEIGWLLDGCVLDAAALPDLGSFLAFTGSGPVLVPPTEVASIAADIVATPSHEHLEAAARLLLDNAIEVREERHLA